MHFLATLVKPTAISKLEFMNILEPIKIPAFTNTFMKMKIVLIVLTFDCFSILDTALTEYQLKIKEDMYIDWEKPTRIRNLIIWSLHFLFSILFNSPFCLLYLLLYAPSSFGVFFIHEVYVFNTHLRLSIPL